MLLPRFSIRYVLILTAVCSLLFIVIAQAVRQHHWAMAVTAAIAITAFSFLLYAVSFLAAYALARATRSLKPPEASHNPFIHEGALPPQIVPRGPFGSSPEDT